MAKGPIRDFVWGAWTVTSGVVGAAIVYKGIETVAGGLDSGSDSGGSESSGDDGGSSSESAEE